MAQDDSRASKRWMNPEIPAKKEDVKQIIPHTKMITTNTGIEVLAFDSGFCPLANHHRTPFTISGVEYLTVYQYVESKKAEYFGDFECSDAVMNCKSAKKIREITNGMKNFNEEVWRQREEYHLWDAISAKIECNPTLANALKATGDVIIAYCNKYDNFLGTGWGIDSEEIKKLDKWGRNLVGSMLMEKRRKL
jgi:ribA/ribD-fused uncharacterized protein